MTYMPFNKILRLSAEPALATALDSTAGSSGMASDAGHTHARRIQSTVLTLNASGEATFVFTRSVIGTLGEPPICCLYHESADNQPIVCKAKSFTTTVVDGVTYYTSVTIKGYRAQTLPQNLVTLLLGAVFNLFGASAPNGVKVSVYVSERTA